MGMGLASGYGAGAGADALKDLIKQKFLEQIESRRAQEAQQQFAQNQQRIDNDASQFGVTSGLNRDKFAEDTKQFGVTSGQAGRRIAIDEAALPGQLAHTTAQTADLNRQPQETLDARAAQTARDAILNKNELGQIDRRTAGAASVAKIRQPVGLSPNQQMTQTRNLQGSYNKIMAPARDMQRQLQAMDLGLAAAQKGDMNAGSQAVISTFNKILDPTSVVRESEYDRTPQGMALLARFQGQFDKISQGGPGVPAAELAKFADLARQITEGAMTSAQTNAQSILDLGNAHGIDPALITGRSAQPEDGAAATSGKGGAAASVSAGGRKVGEVKTFPNGRKAKWNGTNWEQQ